MRVKREPVIGALAAVSLILIATSLYQELRQPREIRKWHGKVWRFIPYDFRWPAWGRIKDTYWNHYERQILTPRLFGIGWGINFNALFTRLRLIQQKGNSEADFLWPSEGLRQLMKPD